MNTKNADIFAELSVNGEIMCYSCYELKDVSEISLEHTDELPCCKKCYDTYSIETAKTEICKTCGHSMNSPITGNTVACKECDSHRQGS